MKTIAILASALLLSGGSASAARGGHDGGRDGGRDEGSVMIRKARRVAVPSMVTVPTHERVSGAAGVVPFPRNEENGTRIVKPSATVPPGHHAAVARSPEFASTVQAQQRVEVVPGRYYWHSAGGVRYAHSYRGGVHWYGFYHGPTFYWTRYYGSRWWWWDARFGGRWVYWWDGFWWWPGPAGTYVFIDDGYYPYDAAGVTVVNEESVQAPAGPPAPGAGVSTLSPDGQRLVQIAGADGEAYLFDKTGKELAYLKFLGRGVEKVRFSGGKDAPLKIFVEFKDGGFALFDKDGGPLDPKSEAGAPAATPPPVGGAEPSAGPPPPPGGTAP